MKFKKLLQAHKIKKSDLKIHDQSEGKQGKPKTKTKSSVFKKNKNTRGSAFENSGKVLLGERIYLEVDFTWLMYIKLLLNLKIDC